MGRNLKSLSVKRKQANINTNEKTNVNFNAIPF